MVTIPGFEGHFEPLLHCLEDQSAPLDDRVDVYLRVTEWVDYDLIIVSDLIIF